MAGAATIATKTERNRLAVPRRTRVVRIGGVAKDIRPRIRADRRMLNEDLLLVVDT
jgi:hypothetical protein